MSKKRIKCILEGNYAELLLLFPLASVEFKNVFKIDKVMESSSGTEESSDEENDELNQSKKFKPIGFGAANASVVHKGWHEARKAEAEVDESSENKNEEQLDEKESQSNSFHSEMAAAGFKKMGKKSISIKIKTGDQTNASLDGTTTGESKKNTISPPINQKQSLINKVKRKLDAKKPDEDKSANVDNQMEPERHISDGEKLQNQFSQYNKSLQQHQHNQQASKHVNPVGHPSSHGHLGEMISHPPGVLSVGPFTRPPYYPYPQSVVPPPIDPRIMPPPMIRPNEMMFNHQMPPPHQIPAEVIGPRGPSMLPNQYSTATHSQLANMNYPLMPNTYPHISPAFPHHHPDQHSNAFINSFLAQQHKTEEEEMHNFNVDDDTAYDLDDNEEASQEDHTALESLSNARTRPKENMSKEIDYDYNYDFEMENIDEILSPQKEYKSSKKSKKSKKYSKHSAEADNYYDKYDQKGYLSDENRRMKAEKGEKQDLDYIKQMLKSLLEMHITEIQNDPSYDFDIKLTLDNLLAQVVDDDGSLTYEDCENIHQIITELFDQEDDDLQQEQPQSKKSYEETDSSNSDMEERYIREKKRKRDSSSKKISKSDMSRKSKKKKEEKRKNSKRPNDSNQKNTGDEHKKRKILTEVEAGEIDDDFEDDLHVEQEFNDLLHNA
jgi:hypothetical protein